MKLVSYLDKNKPHLGALVNDRVYPVEIFNKDLPATTELFLKEWEASYPLLKKNIDRISNDITIKDLGLPVEQLKLLAPVPSPLSCRDGYAFREHVANARRNRKAEMIPEFDQYPVFYFTNHLSVCGPGEVRCMPDHFEKLDFELEAAIVICKHGTNIKAEEANEYIGGLMIMNDLSARRLQMEEMLLNLGPAKGKDFATAIGPWLVTLDGLEKFEVPPKENHTGKNWNLKMSCKVNGVQVSSGNLSNMDWTFAELIERASYGVDLHPGEIIGSGTVGTGCFLELNGTGKLKDPNYKEQWLKPGDVVELEIEQLGLLNNTIVERETDWSILGRKK